MSTDIIVNQIIKLVAKHALCQPTELSINTRLGEDLCIVGDDADELLTEFSTEFNVDMSEMDFVRYFPSEASSDMHYYLTAVAKSRYQNLIVSTIRFLEAKFWRLFAKNTIYQTLTIADLVKAESKGKWCVD